MLFKRRSPPDWWETIRVVAWPRRSWVRSTQYLAKRVLRLTASPHAIAGGIAAGVFASFTPFLGMHVLIASIVAFIVAGNFIAAAAGTFFGNPLTFPFIWASTLNTGRFILKGTSAGNGTDIKPGEALGNIRIQDVFQVGFGEILDRILHLWNPIIMPMMIGSVPLGILFGILSYIITRKAALIFKNARSKRLAAKAKAARAAQDIADRLGKSGGTNDAVGGA